MTEATSNIVRGNLLGTHPLVASFKYSGVGTSADYVVKINMQDVFKYNNQANSVTQTVPGLWNVSCVVDGASADWAYDSITIANAITGTAEVNAVANADAAKLTVGHYYQNSATGEILYVAYKGTAGDSTTPVHLARGLFGTAAAAITSSSIFYDFAVVTTTIEKAASGTKAGLGMFFFTPMPMPGFGQEYFSNAS